MFSKIFFLLVTVCVVNASVLTGNVFDEDPKDEVASSPKDCSSQECDQQCRRLNLLGGACVNGLCKCDNFLNVEANPRGCRDKACYWLCRALNNTSGACVDGRCQCTKSVVEEVSEDFKDSVRPKRCTQQTCNNWCRAFGFHEGICTGSRCSCKSFFSTPKDDAGSELSEDQNERGCNPKACVNGGCKCDNFFGTEEELTDTSTITCTLTNSNNNNVYNIYIYT